MSRLSRSLLAVMAISGVMFLYGCAENPKSKAAKEAREKAQKALKQVELYNVGGDVDYASAKKEVEAAFALAAKAGEGVDLVYVAAGDLAKAHAGKLAQQIDDAEKPVLSKFDTLGKEMLNLANLQAELDVQKFLAQAAKSESEELQGILAGDEDAGLVKKLAASQKKLNALTAEFNKFQGMAQKAKDQADALQARADKMLRVAAGKSGDARISLERKAYRLLMGVDDNGNRVPGKSDYDFRMQEALDQSDIIQAKIAIVEPLVEKLQNDLAEIKSRVASLEAEDAKRDHLKYIASLEGQISNSEDVVSSLSDELVKAFDEYASNLEIALGEYDSAIKNYSKVSSREYKGMADYESAGLSCLGAKLNDSAYDFVNRLVDYADKYLQLTEDGSASKLGEFKAMLESKNETLIEASQAKFTEGFEKFDAVLSRTASSELGNTAVRKYMLLIADRIKQAQKLGQEEVKTELIAKVEEIKVIAIEKDPYFSRSIVAQAFAPYGIEFKTEEEKLIEKYEALSAEFEACKVLEDTERSQQLVSLAEQLYDLNKPQDAKIYDDLVKKSYEDFKADWKAIKKATPDMAALDIYAEFLEADAEAEELAETTETSFESGESVDMFGGGNDANSF